MGQFESFSAFVSMNGYGFFVWLSFGVTLVAILLLACHNWLQSKTLKKEIRQQLARQQRVRKTVQRHSVAAE
ncbi:heme exporter protein CcmD [Neptunicella marina]|uniref:Heme exporter protein D n=1 Tax=Neptunicella marina TaxID=2125989 RepID=A0A8J6IT58_9ALTE|nr:heme exporter protein CcmD [Neptunicella marina]MBC3764968.1 heme exporter protein CcmD [Neptunicella marina]